MTRIVLFLIVLFGLGQQALADGIIDPAERRYSPYVGDLSLCDNPAILARISSTFAQKESYFWSSELQIADFDRVREISLRGNGVQYIPRRYCIARGLLNDDTHRTVIYQIQEGQGIIGFGEGVDWCVVGLDRNSAYSPACSALRPYAERFLGSPALVERY